MSDPSHPSPLEALSDAVSGLVARAAPGVVAVHSRRARSSGFAWRPGLVVTADEALADDGEIAVTLPGGASVPATLAGRDPSTDIAVLRVGGAALQPVPFSQAPVAAGALVVAVGAGEGGPVAAFGSVAFAGGAWRSMRGGDIAARIELDLALRRHAEGGLVMDARGGVVGMAVFGPRRRVLVIPAATVERVAARLDAHGRVARGYLGLGLQAVRGPGAGIMVMSVDPGGPGAAAGALQGDVITAWNGQAVESVPALLRTLGPDSVGTVAAVSVRRAGQPLELRLRVGERPQA